jgi:hypothetical protein
VRGPLPARLGDGVERQTASLGHGGTLLNLVSHRISRRPTPSAAAPPAPSHQGQRGTLSRVEVLISEGARDYIERHGGTVFVRSHAHRCCTGSLTLLDVRTTPPSDAAEFEPFDAEGVAVRFWGGADGRPNRLTIELRGVLARRPVAFWDGCAFKP